MKKETVLLVSSLALALFWFFVHQFNMYDNALVGTITEILWLPMLLLLVVLPVLGLLFWHKQQWKFPSVYLYSLLLNAGTIWILVFYS
jgi:hypothetical protein